MSLVLLIWITLSLPYYVLAQDLGYQITLRRDFGYSMGGDIRGTFSLRLIGEENPVEQVTFLIDDEVIGTLTEAPYRVQFHTDDYAIGRHNLSAEVHLQDGTTLRTEPVHANFISADKEGNFVTTTLISIFGVIVFSFIILAIIQTALLKSKRGQKRSQKGYYGLLGGTICPKCGKPFSRHIWGINLVVGRLDRCEHCGKWVMTAKATQEALQDAEDLTQKSPTKPETANISTEKTLEQRLEDSKYIDQ